MPMVRNPVSGCGRASSWNGPSLDEDDVSDAAAVEIAGAGTLTGVVDLPARQARTAAAVRESGRPSGRRQTPGKGGWRPLVSAASGSAPTAPAAPEALRAG